VCDANGVYLCALAPQNLNSSTVSESSFVMVSDGYVGHADAATVRQREEILNKEEKRKECKLKKELDAHECGANQVLLSMFDCALYTPQLCLTVLTTLRHIFVGRADRRQVGAGV
jgi:hypothetical protein